ncbi:MAG: glycosyltransferase family 2 protein [Planctomycetota bacterium]
MSHDKNVSVTVFFPCHNEQENVARTARQALDVLSRISNDYEVIIVDDGSTDLTGKISDDLANENNNIKVVHHEVNKGYGAALQSGFRAATKNLVFYTDGDGQFDINEMPALIPLMQDFDIVSCYRLNRREGLMRKLNAWAWTKLVCFIFKMKIRDIDCAFKLFKREIFDNIQMQSTGALIDTEILARAIRKGYRITQSPVHHYPRVAGTQSGANISVILRAFKELFKLKDQIAKDTQ